MKTKRDLEFLFELGTLRHMQRAWGQYGFSGVASNLEHTFRVVFLALIIARREKVKNEEKIIKMALFHDLPEARTGDHNYMQKLYVDTKDEQAAEDMVKDTSFSDFLEILHEYEERKSIEAKIVKDADHLDIDVEIKEFEDMGHRLAKKWEGSRKIVREKLYTKTAKELWDAIQKSDPAQWHILTNKLYKNPFTGQ